MRRLPIYFLVDVSESMVGTPIEQVQEGMRTIIQNLRVDPYALETVYVSIIVFAGKAKVLSPLTELYKFYPPIFPIGGGTSLGKGLECLMDDMDRNIQKTTLEQKGDWKPLVFLFTDGNPTDRYEAAFRRWNEKYRRHCNLVAVSLGDNVNVKILGQLTEDVLLLKETDAESFSRFFKWITASIQTSSISVAAQGTDELKLAPTTGINLEKVDPRSAVGDVDENFAVLHARCQTTGHDYLIKFARRLRPLEGLEMFEGTEFKLAGAFPVDSNAYAELSDGAKSSLNTLELVGVPTCPCCGNQIGAVVCQCGNIFCVGESKTNRCPWCGVTGTVGHCGPGGMNITRGLV